MDPTGDGQAAQRRLNRRSKGRATAADYSHYAQAYRALKRRGHRIPAEGSPPRAPGSPQEKAR